MDINKAYLYQMESTIIQAQGYMTELAWTTSITLHRVTSIIYLIFTFKS